MNIRYLVKLFIACWALSIAGAYAAMDHSTMDHSAMGHATPAPTLSGAANLEAPLKENTPNTVTLFLIDPKTGKGVAESALQTVHTQKVHALIIDPTLTDYHHVHPLPGSKAGEYVFEFTPHTPNRYRIWLDVTPVNGTQQYVITDLPGAQTTDPAIIKTVTLDSVVEDYHFRLVFDKEPLRVGEPVKARVVVTDKNGDFVHTLEPVMEAFAHVVAFNQDYRSILHIHPMGTQPKDPAARGGPHIDFMMTPSEAGYVKLFVQVQIDGKAFFAPFGVNVL